MAVQLIETLEGRRLFAFDNWGAANQLMRLPDAIQALPSITGQGQVIAEIDSGIDYTNPYLGGGIGSSFKVIGGYNFVDNNTDVMDTFGHGTTVAGMLAANQFTDGDGLLEQGVAPDAKLLALKIDDDGASPIPDTRIRDALQWCIDHRAQYGITVVNISYGTLNYDTNVISSIYGSQIQTLTDEGVTIVAASGNVRQPTDGINTPAADPNVISVGSVDTDDTISEFTQRGKVLDLLAPGGGVISTVSLHRPNSDGSTIGVFGGTSFASPIVAGTVALMKELDPTLVEKDALSILRASGVKNFDGDTEAAPVTRLNYPRLDVLDALKLTEAREPASPTVQSQIGAAGNGNALAVDSEGVTHYVYYDTAARTMEYATRNTLGEWSATQQIDNSLPFQGYYLSLALDPQGKPSVAYFDGANGDMKFARYNGSTWDLTDIDAKNSVGLYPSLAFDRNGLAVISYYRKTTGDLKVARENLDGTFAVTSIDRRGDVGRSTSVAVDANGRIGVAYEDSSHGSLKFAILTTRSPTWATTAVDAKTSGVSFISAAFSPMDNSPWISYYDATPADLKITHLTGRTWDTTTLANRGGTGLFTTLLFDDNDPNVLYYDKRHDALIIASQRNNVWSRTTLKTNAGRYAFGTIDPTLDILRYSYYEDASASLKVDGDVISTPS